MHALRICDDGGNTYSLGQSYFCKGTNSSSLGQRAVLNRPRYDDKCGSSESDRKSTSRKCSFQWLVFTFVSRI